MYDIHVALRTHLAFEELFNILTMGLRISGNVDRAGRGLLYPQFDSPENLYQVWKAHGHSERQSCLTVVANTLRRGHEVRPRIVILQQFARILL